MTQRSDESSVACAEPVSLTSILDRCLQEFPLKTQGDVLHALDFHDWPTVSLGMFKDAPKPAGNDDIEVTEFKHDLMYQVVFVTQTEQYVKFKLVTRPSKDLRAKYCSPSTSQQVFDPVAFNCREREDEHVIGTLSYDDCDACEGAGTVAETCSVCLGKGWLDGTTQDRCVRCRKGKALALCTRCDGTGYLDVFPCTGRRVFRKRHVLLQDTYKGTVEKTIQVTFRRFYEDSVSKAPPDRAPFSHNDPVLAKRYADVLDALQRDQAMIEETVSRVREDPFIEKRQISTFKTHLNGCKFLVETCNIYHISYTRMVKHTKGLFRKKDVTTRIDGSLFVFDDGKIIKVANGHQEKALD